MINSEREREGSREQVEKRKVEEMQRARLRRTAIFHVTSGSTAPSPREVMRLYSEGAKEEGGGEGRWGGDRDENKEPSLEN